MKNLTLTIFLFFLFGFGNAQTINIESKRMQSDSLRFVLREDLSSSYNNNNGDYIFQIKNNLSSQLKSKDLQNIYFFLFDYSLIRSNDQDFINNWLLHIRYNYQITNSFLIETFIQQQNNSLLDVNSRSLFGGGLRLKLILNHNIRLYIGNSYMYEIESSDTLNDSYYNHRNSSYLSISASILKSKMEIINTTYFQPLYTDFNNYTLLEQFKLDLKVFEKISIFSLFTYYYDSITPTDTKQFTSQISFGVGMRL
ncbi:MAG: DUF481 domain-containing protein [Saprospiraceae bacterium]|nr:DUF481 domain-containing protein [Saprospiraceae bacterium]